VNGKQQQCADCGRPIETDTLSGDFCSECAAKLRSELALSFQLNHFWIQIRKRATRLPIVTLFLVAINFAIYCVASTNSASMPGPVLSLLEMRGAGEIQGQWWRLLTSAFLHLTFAHLISNVVFLFLLGWIAESLFGHLRILLLWMACSMGGSIAELAFLKPNSVALGASGVVYGLIGALLGVYGLRAKARTTKLRILRIVLLALFVGIGLAGDWHVRGRLVPAHVGGLLAGFLTAFVIPLANQNNERLGEIAGQVPD
jgi:rhomboid protease GluP